MEGNFQTRIYWKHHIVVIRNERTFIIVIHTAVVNLSLIHIFLLKSSLSFRLHNQSDCSRSSGLISFQLPGFYLHSQRSRYRLCRCEEYKSAYSFLFKLLRSLMLNVLMYVLWRQLHTILFQLLMGLP